MSPLSPAVVRLLLPVLLSAGCHGVERAKIARCAEIAGADADLLCDACLDAAGLPQPGCVAVLETPSIAVRCGGEAVVIAAPLWLAENPGCVVSEPDADALVCAETDSLLLGDGWEGYPLEPADGAGIHQEREYTFTTDGTDPAEAVMATLYAAAETAVADLTLWQAPTVIGSVVVDDQIVPVAGYGLSGEVEDDGTLDCCTTIAVVDVHLDDEAGGLLGAGGEYRSRFRFESIDDAWQFHEAIAAGTPPAEADWPTRVEIQAKTDREDRGGGLSYVTQSRFSLEGGFPPFVGDDGVCWGSADPAACWLALPEQPWDPLAYLAAATSGVYPVDGTLSLALRPSVDLLSWHDAAFRPRPSVALVTTRQRFHPTVLFDVGLGFPEPSDAFIVSLDEVTVYSGAAWVAWLEGLGPKPPLLASFRELDVEFEPDVSQRLDQAIASGLGDTARLEAIEAAFLADLDTWAGLMRPVLVGGATGASQDDVRDATANKYQTAVAGASFLRGDLDGNGSVATADAAALLAWVYRSAAPASVSAADLDGDGASTSRDVGRLSRFLFAGAAPPPGPWPEPGIPCW